MRESKRPLSHWDFYLIRFWVIGLFRFYDEQGRECTLEAFTDRLEPYRIAKGWDGRGGGLDTSFVKRLERGIRNEGLKSTLWLDEHGSWSVERLFQL